MHQKIAHIGYLYILAALFCGTYQNDLAGLCQIAIRESLYSM